MTFTALLGAGSHFIFSGGITDWTILLMCVGFTLIGALITAKFANKASPKILNRTLGIGLTVMSVAMITVNLIKIL